MQLGSIRSLLDKRRIEMKKVALALGVTLIVLAGCGPSPTPTPTATPTPIVVTFDGNDCTVTGPTELPAGEHTFIFIDRSDMRGELWLVYLEDGKTLQDCLDLQSEPGEWYPKPPWVFYDSRVSIESQESNGRRVDSSTWKLDRVGEHTILCYVPSPQMLWFAAPLMVVETPSE